MVTQYRLAEYAAIGVVADGDFVSIGDYDALKKQHDTLKKRHDNFLKDVGRVLDALLHADVPAPITSLEAAFAADRRHNGMDSA
jgi:hypothetical protein